MMGRACARIGVFAVVAVLFSAQAGRAQELINRRDQHRKMELVTAGMIYNRYCAHCHGENGMGGGRLWPSELSPKPANLTTLGENEDYLIEAISKGSAVHDKSNLCPPWGQTISPADVQRLARYVLALGSETSTPLNTPDSPPSTPDLEPVTDPFPWAVCLFIAAEMGMLLVLLRHGKRGVVRVRQDTAVRG